MAICPREKASRGAGFASGAKRALGRGGGDLSSACGTLEIGHGAVPSERQSIGLLRLLELGLALLSPLGCAVNKRANEGGKAGSGQDGSAYLLAL